MYRSLHRIYHDRSRLIQYRRDCLANNSDTRRISFVWIHCVPQHVLMTLFGAFIHARTITCILTRVCRQWNQLILRSSTSTTLERHWRLQACSKNTEFRNPQHHHESGHYDSSSIAIASACDRYICTTSMMTSVISPSILPKPINWRHRIIARSNLKDRWRSGPSRIHHPLPQSHGAHIVSMGHDHNDVICLPKRRNGPLKRVRIKQSPSRSASSSFASWQLMNPPFELEDDAERQRQLLSTLNHDDLIEISIPEPLSQKQFTEAHWMTPFQSYGSNHAIITTLTETMIINIETGVSNTKCLDGRGGRRDNILVADGHTSQAKAYTCGELGVCEWDLMTMTSQPIANLHHHTENQMALNDDHTCIAHVGNPSRFPDVLACLIDRRTMKTIDETDEIVATKVAWHGHYVAFVDHSNSNTFLYDIRRGLQSSDSARPYQRNGMKLWSVSHRLTKGINFDMDTNIMIIRDLDSAHVYDLLPSSSSSSSNTTMDRPPVLYRIPISGDWEVYNTGIEMSYDRLLLGGQRPTICDFT
jgi:hypothetical protein